MVEITLQLVLQIIQTVSLVIGIIYYLTIMRNQNRAREAQVLLQLNQVFNEKEMIKDWAQFTMLEFMDLEDLREKTLPTRNMEGYLQRSRVWRLLTTLGLILQKGLVSPETIYDTLSGKYIIRMWERDGPIIKEMREQENTPHHLIGYEYLAEAMEKVEERRD